MHTRFSRLIRSGLASKLGFVLLASGLLSVLQASAVQAANIGVACTSRAGTSPTFTMSTKDGYIQLPDANTMYMWGYSVAGDAFQHPGPVLCVNEGDTVTIVLQNTLPEAVSIMFPGQENVTADGAPVQPQFDGSGNLSSLTNMAAAGGGTVTYSFVASNPGTFIYESGTMPQKQVRMGLFGALIVRPTMGSAFVYNRADSAFTPDEEFMVLLSAIDPYQHQATEGGSSYNLNNFQPRYWLINGRGFPDSLSDNDAPFLPDQPYGALARIHTFTGTGTSHPNPGLIRYLNVGNENYPYHPHGNNGLVIGRDGRPLAGPGPAGADLSFEKFAVNIGPGQAWDVVFKWFDAENYSPTNTVPAVIPQVNNLEYGMFYSGSPYLGTTGPLPPGASTLNECGAYYIVSHNHALFQITSWGVNFTGPITFVRVDPPLPNSCP